MKQGLIALSALTLASVLDPSRAAAAPRQPIKPWVVDYAETNCSASRVYGSEQEPTTLALVPSPLGRVMQIIVMRPGKSPPPQHYKATVRFASQELRTTALRYPAGNKEFELIRLNFQQADLAQLTQASHIEIEAKGVLQDSFALPNAAGVMKALDECTTNLQAFWNAGEAHAGNIQTHATSLKSLARYVSDGDFPAQALNEDASGTTRVSLMVDENGVLRACMVEETSGIASFDAQTCAVLRERAKFRPATDAAGKPIRSVLAAAIRWISIDD